MSCGFDDGHQLSSSDSSVLHYRSSVQPLPVAKHFSLQFQFCRDGEILTIERFKLKALMPAHGHGMNYAIKLSQRESGIVEASGLLFHMPGDWQLRLDFYESGIARQFTLDYQIK